MVDVKFWGPSGWSLFHALSLQTGKENEKIQLFSVFQDVLPCKYCRQSTKKFVSESPVHGNVAEWLYRLHDRVNKKLEAQHIEDPTVPLPVESPPFQDVVRQYKRKISDPKLGWDFLYSVAINYDPKIHNRKSHERFWKALSSLYPKELGIPRLTNYFADVHSILKDPLPIEEVYARISSHKSKCIKKTCRKTRRKSKSRK